MKELNNNELLEISGGLGRWDVGITAGLAIVGLAVTGVSAPAILLAVGGTAVVALCVNGQSRIIKKHNVCLR